MCDGQMGIRGHTQAYNQGTVTTRAQGNGNWESLGKWEN